MRFEQDVCDAVIWRHHSGVIVYPFAVVQAGADVGKNVHIGSHSFIEAGAVIGDNVTIKNGCMIWDGVIIEDDCFIGPGVIFTNDARPQSPRAFPERYKNKDWLLRTVVGARTSIGAGCIIGPAVSIVPNSRIRIGTVLFWQGLRENVPGMNQR
jgi:UDP-3-O-[3-hydroxymyristoyl] glucosamine N-acyltransferase